MRGYGWFGLFLILGIKIIRLISPYFPFLASIDNFVGRWFTPLAWWGYILLLDGYLCEKRKFSWFRAPREFIFMLIFSNLCWIVFEGYNALIRNWTYLNLPPSWIEDWAGRIVAYATIFPGIFLTATLVSVLFHIPIHTKQASSVPMKWLMLSYALGALFLFYPLFFPNPYLFAPVWLGFIFFLDPINYTTQTISLLADLRQRQFQRILVLLLSGYICGFLWEYWNSWADTKWVYHIPFPTLFKIYEMPVLGFLGFGPFALECYVMYLFCRNQFMKCAPQIAQTDDPINP